MRGLRNILVRGFVVARRTRGVRWCAVLAALFWAAPVFADGPPEWLPRYDVGGVLDTRRLVVRVCEDVTWTNRGPAAVKEIVFNAHSAYSIPDKDVGFLAKMLEILRVSPSEAMSLDGPALRMEST